MEQPRMRGGVSRRYEAMAEAGEVSPDTQQRALVAKLDRLASVLSEQALASKTSSLGWLFARHAPKAATRGLYIWGGVGRGKTLLMDLFFRAAPEVGKRRVHFHEFMAEVQDRLNRVRLAIGSGEIHGSDPIPVVAAEIGSGLRLLCFDEFAVNDIADAMILGRLFEKLFAAGLTVVATSNVPPDRLYENGLNRALFLPFIGLIENRMEVFHLDAAHDYRTGLHGNAPRYVTPLGPEADRCLGRQFTLLTGVERGEPSKIGYKGRRIPIPQAVNGVARFTFEELCGQPLAAGDYLQVAHRFTTVVLDNIPLLGPANRNEARRLIMLIDALYDKHVRLVASAAAEPEALWQGTSGTEAFEFARTASRLTEMRSDAYWGAEVPGGPRVQSAEQQG